MPSKIRRHLTYANVAATMALVFAMGGTAVAAKHYLINSIRQIRPSVVKELHGANGKNGLPGAAGKTGATGKTGYTGPAGKNGAVAGFYAQQGGTPIYITSNGPANPATIAAKGLPAGNFLVSSSVQLDLASTAAGYASVSCTLTDGSASQAERFTSALGELSTGSFGASAEIPLQIALGSSSAASTATLNCYTAASSGAPVSIDAVNATISAVQTSYNG